MSWERAARAVLAVCYTPRSICSMGSGMLLLRGGTRQGCALCCSLHMPSPGSAPRPGDHRQTCWELLLLGSGKVKVCPALELRVCRG